MSSSVNVADADEFPRPWSLVVRGATWLQLAFGISYLSVLLLYGFARLALGSHDFVTGEGNDPKDLGAGLGNLLARVLHGLGTAAAVMSPFTGVVLGSLVLLGYAVSRRVRADSTRHSRVFVALCVSAVIAVLGSTEAFSDMRVWILD
ncbi:hypothetical protein [Salinispora oceanensis]|uniref:hypothetical protein n=1 Tax=Salinispora oceanensis TaxID=1050199 RepID=UPI0003706772|nr:hypothetical protein [Salinispora oceanensis]